MLRPAGAALFLFLLLSCGAPPKSEIPSLSPQLAGELLHYNNKAQDWMKYVHRQNPGCDYHLELPDQTNHPTTIDLDHIVRCGSRPSPKEFDATISFEYDTNQKKWVVTRFAS
ncbi:MAG TPA: hypothetical protein VHZ55_05660 [Bryobacteraceae bacterium]|jgi:hypothetical protein|nr:hypothetical protein [Bryobacteraceae bacterium]